MRREQNRFRNKLEMAPSLNATIRWQHWCQGADTQASDEPPRGCVVRLAEPDNPLIERDEASRPQRGTPRDVLSSICVYSQRALSQSSLCRVTQVRTQAPLHRSRLSCGRARPFVELMASRPPAEVGSARMLRQAAAADSSDPRRAEGRRAVQGAQWNGSRSEQEAPRSTKWRERRAGARVR